MHRNKEMLRLEKHPKKEKTASRRIGSIKSNIELRKNLAWLRVNQCQSVKEYDDLKHARHQMKSQRFVKRIDNARHFLGN
jgi:hypothetical protein